MKVKTSMFVMSSHLLEHSLPVLPVTNQISYQKIMKGRKVENEVISLGYFWKNLILPNSCREHQTCNNVKLDEDIFFVETNNFPIIQEERSK